MSLLDLLKPKKKRKKTSTRQKAKQKTKKKQAQKQEVVVEDPLMTISRQLTDIRRDLQEINVVLHSGFSGLREDHHKILDLQLTKEDLESFKKDLENRKLTLEAVKNKIESELGMLEIDQKIIETIEEKPSRAIEIAKKLKLSRQYISERLSLLVSHKVVKQYKKGRRIYYKPA